MTSRRLLPALLFLTLLAAAAPVRAEDESALGADVKPAPKSSKKKDAKKKKAGYDYERSKYKSKEESQTPNYKFNERGEPVKPAQKKAAKKKKRSEPPEAEAKPEGSESCAGEETCTEKKSEADAL